jgi:hypothetical protein
MLNNTTVLAEQTTVASRTVLLNLNSSQREVNPGSGFLLVNPDNLEHAARLNELSYAEVYQNVIRPSRVATFGSVGGATAAVENTTVGIPTSLEITQVGGGNVLLMPVSDVCPSFLASDGFLENADNRPRIIPLPSDELTEETASSFIGGMFPFP